MATANSKEVSYLKQPRAPFRNTQCMRSDISNQQAAAVLLDPMHEPEPSAETGLGSSFGSTFAPASQINGVTSSSTIPSASPTHSTNSKNPYRHSSGSKKSPTTQVRASSGSPRPEKFPDYRAEAFGDYQPSSSRRRDRASSHGNPPSYQEATSPQPTGRRRGSSLRERYPGDKSHQPLDIIRRDSKKAYRSPHLNKRSIPGADMIDRLDPAIGGVAYHHEGPYDAALFARNRNDKHAPIKALEDSNREALKATPAENVKDSLERHKPLDGTAFVPPGQTDRFGRKYDYEEGADLMHEGSSGDAGYKRWPGKDYDPDDLKGESEPTFGIDRALRAHTINDEGIEMEDRAHLNKDYKERQRNGTLDSRDPVEIAGGEQAYADREIAEMSKDADAGGVKKSVGGSLRKRIGSLRRKNKDD